MVEGFTDIGEGSGIQKRGITANRPRQHGIKLSCVGRRSNQNHGGICLSIKSVKLEEHE